jgi:hypothetical protein
VVRRLVERDCLHLGIILEGGRQFSRRLHVSTRWRILGSILSIRESAPTLSGLSPEAQRHHQSGSADGESSAAVRKERASWDGPGIDRVPSAAPGARRRRHSQSLPSQRKVRLEIPSINWDKAGGDCWINSPVRIHVEDCWQISRSAWK